MKPARFEYFAPTSSDEALGLLDRYGYDAKVLAGGQSLMPIMNMRLVRPDVIADINGIPDLEYSALPVGRAARQRERKDG